MRRMLKGMFVIPVLMAAGLVLPVHGQQAAIAVPYMPYQQVNKAQAADLIVTGQVIGLEDQDVKATVAPNSPATQTYRIAVIQVTQTLKGKLNKNMIRVAFVPPQVQPQPGVLPGGAIQPLPPVKAGGLQIQPAPAIQPGAVKIQAVPAVQPLPAVQPGQPVLQPIAQPFPIKKPFPIQPNFNVQLAVGMEGLFYLKQHHEGKFYTLVPAYGSFVTVQNKDNFDVEVAQVKVSSNPMGSLKAANPADRSTAAIILVKQYRQPTYFGGKQPQQQPISAEESKLILKGLLEAQWITLPNPINYQNSPAQAFNMLNLQQQDGFQNPNAGIYSPQYASAAKAWLEKNWQTYQIKKYVATGGVGIQPVPPGIQPVPGFAPVPGGVGVQGGIQIQIVPMQLQPLPVPAVPGNK